MHIHIDVRNTCIHKNKNGSTPLPAFLHFSLKSSYGVQLGKITFWYGNGNLEATVPNSTFCSFAKETVMMCASVSELKLVMIDI